jgi:hypothetical protein
MLCRRRPARFSYSRFFHVLPLCLPEKKNM